MDDKTIEALVDDPQIAAAQEAVATAIAAPSTATTKAKRLPLIETFGPTIAGEGNIIGQQTFFARFGLCDYRCTMCDSMHAVNPASVKKYAQWLPAADIYLLLQELRKPTQTNWLTLSGGNPCIHDLTDLVKLLKGSGWRINVETQGTLSPRWLHAVDQITCSPKGPGMGEETSMSVLDMFIDANAFCVPIFMKLVIFDQRDLEFAIDVADRYTQRSNMKLDNFYLSLGNPTPPDEDGNWGGASEVLQREELLRTYRMLFEDIKDHPLLSKMKFLPQWHIFAFGNAKGK